MVILGVIPARAFEPSHRNKMEEEQPQTVMIQLPQKPVPMNELATKPLDVLQQRNAKDMIRRKIERGKNLLNHVRLYLETEITVYKRYGVTMQYTLGEWRQRMLQFLKDLQDVEEQDVICFQSIQYLIASNFLWEQIVPRTRDLEDVLRLCFSHQMPGEAGFHWVVGEMNRVD